AQGDDVADEVQPRQDDQGDGEPGPANAAHASSFRQRVPRRNLLFTWPAISWALAMPPARPILAVSSGPLWRLETPHAFEVIKASGAEGVEIMVTQSTDTQDPNALERLANRNDLPIVAVHAPQLLLTRNVFSSNQLEKVRRTV